MDTFVVYLLVYLNQSRTLTVVCVSVIVNVDAKLGETSVNDVGQCEVMIVSQWTGLHLSPAEQIHVRERVDEILRPFGISTRLLVVKHDNSIALYFICMTLSALLSLRDHWRSGQLKDIIQILFTFLSGATQPVLVERLTWPETDDERCLNYFGLLPGWAKLCFSVYFCFVLFGIALPLRYRSMFLNHYSILVTRVISHPGLSFVLFNLSDKC